MSFVIQILFLLLPVLLLFYIVGIFYLRRGLRKVPTRKTGYLPSVSVIVSMHNEEKNARQCIQHLLNQNYPRDLLEILIVNDRSTDQTEEIVKHMSGTGERIKYFRINIPEKNFAPKKYAIDYALQRAGGELIVLTDADGRPGPEWITTISSHFSEDVGMVIGYAPYATEPPYGSLLYRLLALEYLSHAAVACASAGLGYPLTCVGTNMAYRKRVYEQLGGFGQFRHIHTGDDDLLLQRVREESDWAVVYCADAQGQVFNAPPASPKKFFNQRLRYASKGFLYPRKITFTLIIYYLLNLLIFISPFALLLETSLFFPVLISLLLKASADFFFLNRSASVLHDRRHIKLFPFAFILHIPYVLLFGFLSQFKQFEWGSHKS